MPQYYESADKNSNFSLDMICSECNKQVGAKQSIFVCSECKMYYHPACKKIIGQHIQRLAADIEWICSAVCREKTVKRKTELEQNKAKEQLSHQIVLIGTKLDKFDTDFEEVKNLIRDLNNSQEFVISKFEEMKVQFHEVLTENSDIKKELVKSAARIKIQEVKTNKLEAEMDRYHQLEYANNLIIAGLPNNTNDSEHLVTNILTELGAENLYNDIKAINYMEVKRYTPKTSTSDQKSMDYKILVKFHNPNSKFNLFEEKYRRECNLLMKLVLKWKLIGRFTFGNILRHSSWNYIEKHKTFGKHITLNICGFLRLRFTYAKKINQRYTLLVQKMTLKKSRIFFVFTEK